MKNGQYLTVFRRLVIAVLLLLLSSCPSGFLYEVVEEIELAERGFAVSFNTAGGTSVATQYIQEDGLVTMPPAPSRTGYTFLGWYHEESLTTLWDFDNDTVTDSTVLYAGWEANQYEVSFDLSGGTGSNGPVTAVFGSPMPDAGDPPTRTGYYFYGYYSDENGGGTRYYTSSMQSDHVWDRVETAKLYAYWVEPPAEHVLVSFDSQGADTPAVPNYIEVELGASVDSLPDPPVRSGYHFNGWWTETDGQGNWFGTSMAVNDAITVYAHWITEFSDGATRPPTDVVCAMVGLDQIISPYGEGETVFTDAVVDSGNPLYSDYPGLTLNGMVAVLLSVEGEVETITIDGVINFSGNADFPYLTVTFDQTTWTRSVEGAVNPISVYDTTSGGSLVFDSSRYQMAGIIGSIKAAAAMMDVNLELIDLAIQFTNDWGGATPPDGVEDAQYVGGTVTLTLLNYSGYPEGYLEPLGLTTSGEASVTFISDYVFKVNSGLEDLFFTNFAFSSISIVDTIFEFTDSGGDTQISSVVGSFTADGDNYDAADLNRIIQYLLWEA
ncbi:MAG: InlB B-repeat-containing protein [Spirochaetaceae bacterium]|nr:InlB B-repeat-containing protein [Spirochaetaceae bacterium]MCF7938866.1 InlB B-repeat-containing protein [Spirochaetales bacterium]